tara:strand:+ start:775 stop:900 length:126 start_codon:yes stop_codon:yes gene_type:complete
MLISLFIGFIMVGCSATNNEGKKWEWDPAKGVFRLIFKTTQ